MKLKDIRSIAKAVGHAAVAVKVIGTAVKVGAKAYSLIPKYDKIEGIDTEALTENLKVPETPVEVIIEEKRLIAELEKAEEV